MPERNLEINRCDEYLQNAMEERILSDWLEGKEVLPPLLIAEGFEERSLGLLRIFSDLGLRSPFLGLARYSETEQLNKKYREEFERRAEMVAPGRWRTIINQNNRSWVEEAMKFAGTDEILIDISGLTTRGLFAALDAIRNQRLGAIVGYSEALEYRPTCAEWIQLISDTEGDYDRESLIAEKVDEAPWLYGGVHRVKLLESHEGYDSAGVKALVAFLPFKPVRLGSLLDEQQYSTYTYIAGRPRLEANAWRLEALKQMNAAVIKEGRIVEMETFGYRGALRSLALEICGPTGLLAEYDVHLAPLGSKLQSIACWILSTLVPPITVLTTIPDTWHPEDYSHGVGASWIIKLAIPD